MRKLTTFQALEPGEYIVKADIEANGQLLETVTGILKIFPKPAWIDNNIAIDHSVPPPWKEIETVPQGNKVLLREYVFNDKVMFQQIINPQTKMDWRNLNNNYDTLAAKGKLM